MQREMIGETIRKFRAERKLSREMLAEQTGISVSHLEKIENNENICKTNGNFGRKRSRLPGGDGTTGMRDQTTGCYTE